jgi:hypothetical protein
LNGPCDARDFSTAEVGALEAVLRGVVSGTL